MAIITELNATNWAGKFAEGAFNANQQKKIMNIHGEKEDIGSFEAYRSGDQMNYDLHFSDPSKAAELASWASGIVEGIQAELDA